jgi:ribonucleoside-diphosphate reductase alpha chain
MPSERSSVTRKVKIGDLEGYVTVGMYEDGTVGEVFLTFGQPGSFERGLCHALALVISLALQRGVSLEKICEKLTGLQFEPRGVTGDRDIPMVSSLADYLGRWLSGKVKEA